MSKLDEINKLLDELSVSADNARAEKVAAEESARRADEEAKKAENAKAALEDVRKKGQEFEESYNEVMKKTGYSNTEENTKKKKIKKENKKGNGFKGFIAGVLATSITLTGGHFIGVGVSNVIRNSKDDKKVSNVQEYTVDEKTDNALASKFREFLENKGIVTVNKMASGRVVVTPLKNELTASEIKELSKQFFTDELFVDLLGSLDIEIEELTEESKVTFCRDYISKLNIAVDEIDVNNAIENIITEDEELNTENFEKKVADFAKVLNDANINVNTEQVVKFVSIINIDKLCEENAELASELFATQTKEEYMTDVFTILGAIAQYNSNLYFDSDTKGTTNGFIRVSDAVIGNEEKEIITYYESYVDRMAEASMKGDEEEVNHLAEEFHNVINDPTSDYSYVSDGIGLGLYSSIESMINTVSRDSSNTYYLNEMNQNRLVILSHSEKYISNIHRQYEQCTTDVKTKSLTK